MDGQVLQVPSMRVALHFSQVGFLRTGPRDPSIDWRMLLQDFSGPSRFCWLVACPFVFWTISLPSLGQRLVASSVRPLRIAVFLRALSFGWAMPG